MGEECSDCSKWEEDMYWTHFKSVMFYQDLPRDFDQQLAMPEKFAHKMKEKLPENVTVIGPSGAKWNVGLVSTGDTLLFKSGWKEFVEDHSLEEGDVLIFRYIGEARFDVLMFNGRSSCERESSYFVRKCGHTELDSGFQIKRNTVENSVEVGHELSDSGVGCTQSKRPRKYENLKSARFGRHPQARIRVAAKDVTPHHGKHVAVQKDNSVVKDGAVGAYPLQYVSNRRPVTEEEKENVLQMARAASTEDSFIVVMRASHVYRGFYMSIPFEWAVTHFSRKSQYVILRVKGKEEKTWQVRYIARVLGSVRGGALSGGWKNFSYENNLEESDACLFELASRTPSEIVMDVSIFRVVPDVNPLTRVTRSPSRRSKYPRRK